MPPTLSTTHCLYSQLVVFEVAEAVSLALQGLIRSLQAWNLG